MARFDFIAVYIMASKPNGTLYTGCTSDLYARLEQHQSGHSSAFTGKYDCKTLVFAERHETMETALNRERTIKGWPRAWKVHLIESQNPDWQDLSQTWL